VQIGARRGWRARPRRRRATHPAAHLTEVSFTPRKMIPITGLATLKSWTAFDGWLVGYCSSGAGSACSLSAVDDGTHPPLGFAATARRCLFPPPSPMTERPPLPLTESNMKSLNQPL
jgi:hypothetical protein